MELSIGTRFTLRVLDPDGVEVDRRSGHNMMMANGLTALAQALMWSGAEDQAAAMGLSGPDYLAPLWGAVGTGTQTPVPTLTALRTEVGRATVSSAGYTAATGSGDAVTAFLFYLPGPATAWTLTEAGMFATASSTAGSGTLLDYWQFSPSVVIAAPNSLVLQADLDIGG